MPGGRNSAGGGADFPGFDYWLELYGAARDAIKDERHLEGWRTLGEQLSEWDADVWLSATVVRRLCGHMRRLNAGGEYPGVEQITRGLEGSPRVVRVDGVERALREYLSSAEPPRPWLVMAGRSTRFLDAEPLALTNAELGILWVLAGSLRREVSRSMMIRQANLDPTARNVSPHVSRLRAKLRPAIDAKFASPAERPPGDESSFIIGARNGSYRLEMDRLHILIKPPRPDFMPPS